MQVIDTVAALDGVADPPLRPILERYRDMMDLATIYVIEPGDTLSDLADRRGRDFAESEFIIGHPGGWFEVVFITCDDGAGDVILIPDRAGIDTDLLRLCRDNADSKGHEHI